MTRIAVFVGSLRKDSFNMSLAKNIEALMPEGFEFDYIDMDLPLYNQDLDGALPQKVVDMKKTVEADDGVLLVTPEYNRSFSGVIKNAIDWASRPWGQSSFAGKSAAIIGASMGALGATQAQQALRNVALFLDMKLMGQPEVYFNAAAALDEDGKVVEGSKDLLKGFADAFAKHVEANK
ncbi:NAD(P)H-dependent oxidoreductase [Bifidobacterium sp. ESL0763]|uniref:NADPH-dependent FMN reductase n=1 Tax=Bifidobacterium sp. ESL0763 TaxID=2983227 RepID=UPI0023F83EDD|nr:NAD(P)H-dependent oxidoreductase [Bifidobacterium sp. ESL0763]MDF7663561.1 NAD(P)H-dependent oxidoreductase [Bifidobacterium sp. ESL0763]